MGLAALYDSVNVDSLFASVEDSTVRAYHMNLSNTNRAFIDSEIVFFTDLEDSLIGEFADIASFLQNLASTQEQGGSLGVKSNFGQSVHSECNATLRELNGWKRQLNALLPMFIKFGNRCDERKNLQFCKDCDRAAAIHEKILECMDQIAALTNMYLDCICKTGGGTICNECQNTAFVGIGPQNKRITGGYGPDGFSTKGVCTNIIRYKRNVCIVLPRRYRELGPFPQELPEGLKCPPPESIQRIITSSGVNDRPHPGSIIKVANAPVPYNIVGILNDNGKAFIPHVPMNTRVTFSLYDPITGLYDPDVGTYTTGSVPGGFDWPILLFLPNTEIRRIAMRIGEIKHDSVSLDWQRIDYVLNVSAADMGKMINVGFEASALLSVRFEDPNGNILVDNTNTDCYFYPRVRLNEVGSYMLRVSYSISGQAGSFAVGVDYYPKPPTGTYFNLCGGFVVDTLYEELSPYLIEDPLAISTGDTVVVEQGVHLLFDHGGSVTSSGVLIGDGSHAKPIKLKQVGTVNRRLITIKEPVSGRKEVER